MITQTNEKSLEALIEASFLNQGYIKGFSPDYNKSLCIDEKLLFSFIENTQAEEFAKIKKRHGEHYQDLFCKRLFNQIQQNGIIEVLRKGITDGDVKISLLYPIPSSNKNPQTLANYQKNIFSVTRQLYYSEHNNNSLDMAIFINGLPVITFELKNQWTNQTVEDAKKQYKEQRDPKEPIFNLARCLVHLAVDTDEVFMTTFLNGNNTAFLPFNKGYNNGKGNPPNPNGIKTDYLWQEILTKESLSNIIEKYAQLVVTKNPETKKIYKSLIFPRYHQLTVVRKLLAHAKEHNTGQKYLIQHSAGSGKSNSLTWLAHQLVELHSKDDTQPVFNTVVVVTDRRVLDKQIRENIKQFSQVKNVVEAITDGSSQLKTALENGKKLIITTIQKFPYVVDEIGKIAGNRYAIIIDEAHSSQSGKTAGDMNKSLSGDEELDTEDQIIKAMEARKLPQNISYFAFTATPKNKTLELFGTKRDDGKRQPFHLYSMKQAIQEEFILDVLKNYTTYQSYYKLLQTAEENPLYDTNLAKKKLKAYVEGHEFTIAKKADVMLEHFNGQANKIKGQARAMVVTSSIISAIKYKQAFDKKLKGTPYKAIVAFSGTKKHEGEDYTEAGMNGFPSNDIPSKFKEKDYRFLIVAEKYQTGFDEPLLHTMYVDKPLSGVQAVQTLSRLNRAYKPYKTDTFVLDFVNTSDDIKEAFQPYYETTLLSKDTDVNKLNDLEKALADYQVYTEEEVEKFTKAYFEGEKRDSLESWLDNDNVKLFDDDLDDDQKIDFKVKATSFVKTYAFLSLILPFSKKYFEELYWFLKFLIPKLRILKENENIKGLFDSVDLESYTQHRQALNENIKLIDGNVEIDPITTQLRGSNSDKEKEFLDKIIQSFNERWGNTEWSKNDKVKKMLFEDLPEEIANDENYIKATRKADFQNTKITFNKMMEERFQDLIFDFTDLYKDFADNDDFKKDVLGMMFDVVMKKQGMENRPGKF